jgi:hypothetical protein
MKKTLTLLSVLTIASCSLFAQESSDVVDSEVLQINGRLIMKTPPLKKLMKYIPAVNSNEDNYEAKPRDGKKTADWSTITDHGIPENNGVDPALQSEMGARDGSKMTKASWQAQGGGFPPDPTGAAGKDAFVQAVNSSYRVYDKTGGTLSFSLSLGSLWSGTNDGDPIVMYDRYADRWFISQFKPDQAGNNDQILIAISETSDATGSYFAYEFDIPLSGMAFPDYPKFGVWHDGYYMSANSSSKNCVIFEREQMLIGATSPQMVVMTFPSMPYFFRSYAPAYAEGLWEPDADEPFYYFHVQDNSWSGVTEDHIKVLKCEVDWVNTGNSTITIDQSITTDAFNSVFTGSWDDITQQGTSQKLDAVAGIFMYRAQYRRFPGYNTMALCHTVDVGSNRAGVRWYELRDSNDGNWFMYQQGTYAPDATNSRWMGSAAIDLNGNYGLAYAFAGSNNYAGIRYTGRFRDDPLNQMTIDEQIAVEGEGAQTGGNRYGDYSQMSIDPADDATFWFTGEYLGNGGSRRTRIFSFAFWQLLGDDENVIVPENFSAFQPNKSSIKLTWSGLKDTDVTAQLFDMNGKLILSEKLNTPDEQKTFDLPPYAKGIYVVRLSGENTNLSTKLYVN